MRSSAQSSSNTQLNNNKKLTKNKKQMQQDLLTLYNNKSRHFRVFYPILEDDGCVASDLNESHQIVFPKDMLLHPQSSIYSQHSLLSLEGQSNFIQNSDIFKWFDQLSISERVNALTCTSPYLTEVLANMHRLDTNKGISSFFAQSNKKMSLQNYFLDPSLSKHFKDSQAESEMQQFQKYNQQFYLGSLGYQSKYQKYPEAQAYGYNDYEQSLTKAEHIRLYPQFFEDVFYTRQRHLTEVQQLKINDPFKFFAQQMLQKFIRFCDMYQYCDTISVDFNLVASSQKFFEIMSNCTEGKAFTTKCNLVYDPKLGVHQIDNPYWFKPDKFNTFYAWVAAILEENLWANFQFFELSKIQVEKNQPPLDYLFDFKQLQITKETQQLVNIRNLTHAWLNASAEKKIEVTESLLNYKTIKEQLQKEQPKSLKDIYMKRDFFVSDARFSEVNEVEIQYVVEKSLKLSNRQKYHLTHEFISELYMSMPQTIQTPRDVIHRHFLQLVKDMHQELVIEELLGLNHNKTKKRKNKKKDKQQKPVDEDIAQINNNKSELKMAETKQKSDQKDRLQKQSYQNKAKLSQESIIQNDVRTNISIEQVIESSDNDTLVFKDPIDSDADFSPNEMVQVDMHAISNNYVSSMLCKIELELTKDKQAESKTNGDGKEGSTGLKKTKKKKSKKAKDQVSNKVPETNSQTKVGEKDNNLLIQSVAQNKPSNNQKLQNNQQKNKDIQGGYQQIYSKTEINKPNEQQTVQKNSGNSDLSIIGQTQAAQDNFLQPQKQNRKKKNNKSISIIKPSDEEFYIKDLIVEQLRDQQDLLIKNNNTLNIQSTKAGGKGSRGEQICATQSRNSSRQASPNSAINPENQSQNNTGGRKRNRKKNKGALDPQEAMNQFIQQLNSKKDDGKSNFKQSKKVGANSRIQSRRNSNTEQNLKSEPVPFKQIKRGDPTIPQISQPKKSKQKNLANNSMMQQDLQQLLLGHHDKQYVEIFEKGTQSSQQTGNDCKQTSTNRKVQKQATHQEKVGKLQYDTESNQHATVMSNNQGAPQPPSMLITSASNGQQFSATEKRLDQKIYQKSKIDLKKQPAMESTVNQKYELNPGMLSAHNMQDGNADQSQAPFNSQQMVPQADQQLNYYDANSKFSTISPSFKPINQNLNTQKLQQPNERDEAMNTANQKDKHFASQHNSFEQMAFNLNNIKSFNPSIKNINNMQTPGLSRLNTDLNSQSYLLNQHQQMDPNSPFLAAFQSQGMAHSNSIASGQTYQQSNMLWSPPDFQYSNAQQLTIPFTPLANGGSAINSMASMQKPNHLSPDGGMHSKKQQKVNKQAYGETSNSNSPPQTSNQGQLPGTNVVTISDQLNVQNQTQQNLFYPQKQYSGFREEPNQNNFEMNNFVNMTMGLDPNQQQSQFGKQYMPVNQYGTEVWTGNANGGQQQQMLQGFNNRAPNLQYNCGNQKKNLICQCKTLSTTTAQRPPQPETQKQNQVESQQPPQTLQLSQQTVQQQNVTPGGEQMAQVSQMNSFNINVFGNLNIGSLVQNNNNATTGVPQDATRKQQMELPGNEMQQDQINIANQIKGLVGMPFMNMQLGQVNNNQPQFMAHPATPQQQSMYPSNYFYDFNLSQTIEFKFYEKFDNDIYDEVNRIQVQLDQTKDERNYVLNKLQKMCEQVFKKQMPSEEQKNDSENDKNITKPKIMQFGSLMTGLALESSDMDMAVTNLFLPDRQKMIDSLDLFADYLQKWDIIKDLNAISTASIPVIKANIDLKLLREQEIMLQDKTKTTENTPQDFGDAQSEMPKESKRANSREKDTTKNNNELSCSEIENLKIDITFDDNMGAFKPDSYSHSYDGSNSFFDNINQKTHQGLASSQLIKNYVEHYKCLKEVSIILKQFLGRMDLNSPYHGGISSYSTVLLLVAYMNKWNLKMSSTLTPSRLLMGFLDYYSYYFNASLFGIDVSNNGSFYELGSPESNFIILDPLNSQNNTTRNSFLTHDIIKSFRKAFNSLKNLLLHYQQTKNSDIKDNLLDLILQRNQAPIIEQKILQLSCEQKIIGLEPALSKNPYQI